MKIAKVLSFIFEKSSKKKKKFKEEDEMASAILSTAPQGGALECRDNYALEDMRVPKVFNKIQRRKKKNHDKIKVS